MTRTLDALPRTLQDETKAAAWATGRNIANEARARVRRATGATAAAISVEEDRARIGVIVHVDLSSEVWPNLDLGLEFGTKYMEASPFLHPAVELERGAHDRRIERALETGLRRA